MVLFSPVYADRDDDDDDRRERDRRESRERDDDRDERRRDRDRDDDRRRDRDRDDDRRADRERARDRLRDFFCSRTGRCRPGDPQVDELSTATMGVVGISFIVFLVNRRRKDELEKKKDDS